MPLLGMKHRATGDVIGCSVSYDNVVWMGVLLQPTLLALEAHRVSWTSKRTCFNVIDSFDVSA